MSDLLLGVDIGATGIKTGFFAPDGSLIALAGRRNGPVPQPDGEPGWLIWDAEDIWSKVCECIAECLETVGDPAHVKAVACTGFGTDGLPLDASGNRLYPFISWHDSRTVPQSRDMAERVGNDRLFAMTGYHNYPINTVNRLLWYRQNRPDLLDKTHRWLQMQDYIAFRFSGEFSTECTIASTTMMLNMAERTWSDEILKVAEVDPAILPTTSEAGTQIGAITVKAAKETGLRVGTPVVTGGHDCEIAVLGAGVNQDDVFIDITGTWEILIALVSQFEPKPEHYDHGLDFECHAIPGQWICQSLMIAGGVLEWIRAQHYADTSDDCVYETMFSDAAAPAAGVYLLPSFMRGMGPSAAQHALGTILGLTTATSRGQIVRAAIEGLCFQLRQQVAALEGASGRRASRLRVVGGGQKNPLWLQMKADVTGLPVEITTNPEVTLLGVALLAGVGAGMYGSVDEALGNVRFPTEDYAPDGAAHAAYGERYEYVYARLAPALAEVYGVVDDEL
jgi:L-fuculokinase